MEQFRFVALDAAGNVRQGQQTAVDDLDVRRQLERQHLRPVRIEPARKFALLDLLNRDIEFGAALTRGERALFVANLASLLEAGIGLDVSLAMLARMARRHRAADLVRSLGDAVREGRRLSDALAADERSFPADMRAIVRAGEDSGRLAAALTEVADYLARSNAIRQKVLASLYYPIFLIVMAVASIVVVVTLVLPEFEPIFASAGAQLPLVTRIVRVLGVGLVDYFWIIAALAFVLAAAVVYLRRMPPSRRVWDRTMLRLPLLGHLLLVGQSAAFARILGAQLSGGVQIVPALETAAAALSNAELAAAVGHVKDLVKRGSKLAFALGEVGGFPDMLLQLVRVGEETGKLNEMLLKVARLYEEQLRLALDRIVAAMVPALTLLMGLVVAAIVFSVLAAILSLNRLV